jgi:hypothetical protein
VLPDPIVRPRVALPSRLGELSACAPLVELLWSEVNPRPIATARLPDDEIADESLPPDLALRRAAERYPVDSIVTGAVGEPGTLREAFTQSAQRQFWTALSAAEPGILARLDQPFGKDNLSQCFYSTPGLRHVLLPLWKSGFLYEDPTSWNSFCDAYFPASNAPPRHRGSSFGSGSIALPPGGQYPASPFPLGAGGELHTHTHTFRVHCAVRIEVWVGNDFVGCVDHAFVVAD